MAEVHKKGLNAQLVWEDLQNCCISEAACGQCQGEACIIGFAKECIKEYQKKPQKEVPSGTERIPTMDYKAFDEVELEIAIAHILKECKDCKEDHVEDCIINVIRNCYEVGLFGDVQTYEGSTLQYLMKVQGDFPEKSIKIAEAYRE
ncbi:MAG: hypothetical protein K2N41_09285 [Lachnospiraceae bacterium]|nr:hypothetical protein [Lachnospiraceae bacterium]MDE7239887.1 hypothetical protein [Lachnospiraceae bacterium]